MNNSRADDIKTFGYYRVVRGLSALSRTLWRLVVTGEASRSPLGKNDNRKRGLFSFQLPFARVKEYVYKSVGDETLAQWLLDVVVQEGFIELNEDPNAEWQALLDVAMPHMLVRAIVGGVRPEPVLRYNLFRSVREHYEVPLSPQTASLIHKLTQSINAALAREERLANAYDLPIVTRDALAKELIETLDPEPGYQEDASLRFVDFFLESSRIVNFLRLAITSDSSHQIERPKERMLLRFRTNSVDGEFLISSAFSTPTGVEGLDTLLGGAGMVFPEPKREVSSDPLGLHERPLGGRVIVIVGPRGSGKTILAARIGMSLAQNRGFTCMMPLEQDVSDTIYLIKSTQGQDTESRLPVLTSPKRSAEHLQKCLSGDIEGVFSILPPDLTNFEEFLELIKHSAQTWASSLPTLFIIDPVNTIPGASATPDGSGSLRRMTVDLIETTKRHHAHLILVLENDPRNRYESVHDKNLEFLERVADTVIQLSVRKHNNYAQRFCEISKSRLQREQRGEHPFSIFPGTGVHIYPSPASVAARMRMRQPLSPVESIRFGYRPIDRILGEKSIYEGDIIAFSGPSGSFKTELGIHFLLSARSLHTLAPKGRVSVLFSSRDRAPSIRHIFQSAGVQRFIQERVIAGASVLDPKTQLEIIELPYGHVQPAVLLQLIERSLHDIRLRGYSVNRVMVDNVGQWELTSPSVREDPTFATTLVDLLRGLRVTTLVVCSAYGSPAAPSLQKTVVDNADAVFEFDRFSFRGIKRVNFSITKTRGNAHRQESYEVSLDERGSLTVNPTSSLLRLDHSTGTATPIDLRLFLHYDSLAQHAYYNSLAETLKSVLTKNVNIDFQNRLYFNRAMKIGKLSAVDELQILQLDEWQLELYVGGGQHKLGSLYPFDRYSLKEEVWKEYHSSFRVEAVGPGNNRRSPVVAVPYLQNISFLAYRKSAFPEGIPAKWPEIEKKSIEWRAQYQDNTDDAVFFDMPLGSTQNLICFYLEILLSLTGSPRPRQEATVCSIRGWLSMKKAIDAGRILRQMCLDKKVSDFSRDAAHDDSEKPYERYRVKPNAVLWRHWYTTYNQMIFELEPKSFDDVRTTPLPGDVTIAGEWYLGVPEYSAAPDAGLKVIQMMTTPDAENSRLRMGVGLPTRSAFYEDSPVEPNDSGTDVDFTRPSQKVATLLQNAFRRSDLRCYPQIMNSFGHALQRIIEIREPLAAKNETERKKELNLRVDLILRDLLHQLDILQTPVLEKDKETDELVFERPFCRICKERLCGSSRVSK